MGTMLFCFTTGHCLKKREDRKTAEDAAIKAHNAQVAFE